MSRRLYLSEKFFLHLGLSIVFGVLSFEISFFFWVYLLLFCFVLGRAWADYSSLPIGDGVESVIHLDRPPILGREVIVSFIFSDPKRSCSNAQELILNFPELNLIELSQTEKKSGTIRTQKTAEQFATQATYKCISLGYEEVKNVELVIVYGYWRVNLSVNAINSSFRVMPPRNELSPQAFVELSKNQKLFSQGSRRLLRGQAADQFHSIRKYQFPDSIRHIDSKKTARLGQLMTRIYDTYYNHHLVLALDVGRSMSGRVGESHKQDFQLSACIALAEHAIKSRDKVSFFAFSQKIEHSIQSVRDMRHFEDVYRDRAPLHPKSVESNYDLVLEATQKLAGQRALLVLFTDVTRPSIQTALKRVMQALCLKHLCVLVSLEDEQISIENRVLKLNDQNMKIKSMDESSEWLYLYWLNHEIEKFRREISQLGGGLVSATQSDWMSLVTRLYVLMRESVRA